MTALTITEARKNLYRLIDEVAESHRPARLRGRRNSAVLISEDDWRAIEEILFCTGFSTNPWPNQ